jgi:hypothetical protein
MAINSIELREVYIPAAIRKYAKESVTSVLDSDGLFHEEAGKYYVKKVSTTGLGDYDKNSADGYPSSAVTIDYQEIVPETERATSIDIDRRDEAKSGGAFNEAMADLMEQHVGPETDATRIAKIFSSDLITKVEEDITTGEAAIASLRKCMTHVENNAVNAKLLLFVNPNFKGMVDDMDTTKSRKVMENFEVHKVMSSRFWTAIEKHTGRNGANGYSKAEGASAINYICVPAGSVGTKLDIIAKVLSPDQQRKDCWSYPIRIENIIEVFEARANGIYASYAPAE